MIIDYDEDYDGSISLNFENIFNKDVIISTALHLKEVFQSWDFVSNKRGAIV
jgi:hypothetical protein